MSVLTRRQFLTACGSATLCAASPVHAQPQWPNRTIRLVIPYTAGGSSDIIARLISEPLSESLKQSVIVDDRPGANGNLGSSIVAQSTDQHTLLLADLDGLEISPSIYKLNFDPGTDMRGVSMLAYSPHILAVHPSVPASTLPELVALSKQRHLNFAVTAVGSAPHLAAIAVQQATGARWQYVPYKGGSQAIIDTITGQTDIIMNGMLATLPYVQNHTLKAIAVSKRTRMAIVPQIATIAEQGVKDFESGTWQGVMAPATMPAGAVALLSREMARIIQFPTIASKLSAQGAEVVVMTPGQLNIFLASERKRWAEVVEKGNVHLD